LVNVINFGLSTLENVTTSTFNFRSAISANVAFKSSFSTGVAVSNSMGGGAEFGSI
jgi:hypothetical protein